MRYIPLLLVCLVSVFLWGCRKSPSKELSSHAQQVIFGEDSAAAKSATILSRDSAYSTVQAVQDESGASIVVLKNRDYLAVPVDSMIISQAIEWVLGPWDGNEPLLEATGYGIGAKGISKPRWTVVDSADAGRLLEGVHTLYQTEAWGCCGDCVTYRLYNPATGRELLGYNHQLAEISVSLNDSGASWRERYIGALERPYVREPGVRNDSLLLVQLTYASVDSSLHTLLIRARTAEAHERTMDGHFELMRLPMDSALQIRPGMKAASLVSVASMPVSSLSEEYGLRIAFGDEDPVFVIPLKGDDFVVEKTDFSDYEIIRLK